MGVSAEVRRAIRISKADGSFEDLEITKASKINDTDNTMSVILHIDRLPDGKLRIVHNSHFFPDLTKVIALEIIRED